MVKNYSKGKVKPKKTTRQIVRDEISKMSETKKHMRTLQEVLLCPRSQTANPGGATPGMQIYQMNDIPVGTSNDQRIGNSINITGLGLRGLLHGRGLTIDGSTSQNAVYVRHAILKKKAASDVTEINAADTRIFLNNNTSLSYESANNVQRYILPFNHKDFDILFQKTEKLGIVNTQQTQNYFNNKKVSFYNRQDFKCEWFSDSSAFTDEGNPGIYYIIYVGNLNMDDSQFPGNEITLGACEVNMALNLYYKDM